MEFLQAPKISKIMINGVTLIRRFLKTREMSWFRYKNCLKTKLFVTKKKNQKILKIKTKVTN